MDITIEWIARNFNKFNRQYFNGQLPTPRFIVVDTRRMLGQCGAKNWRAVRPDFYIKMSNHFDRSEYQFQNTLIHEMIHLYFQSKRMWNVRHGREFQMVARSFDKYGWDIHTKSKVG